MSKTHKVTLKISSSEWRDLTERMKEAMAQMSAATTIASQYPRTKFSLGTVWHLNGSCQPVTIVGSLTRAAIPTYPCIAWKQNGAKAVWAKPTALHYPDHEEFRTSPRDSIPFGS